MPTVGLGLALVHGFAVGEFDFLFELLEEVLGADAGVG